MEKQINRKDIYKGKIISVFEDEVLLDNGRKTEREVIEHRGVVACLPFIGGNEIILVKQYRYPVKREMFEIPAGIIERGENPEYAVRRELLEETGYSSNNIEHIVNFYTSPGYSTEALHLFFAYNLKKEIPKLDYDESISIKLLPLRESLNMIKEGRICDAKTIISIVIAISKVF